MNYVFLPLTLVCNPFHGRYLSYNSITSIPSGAFSGLTALNALWGGCYGFVWINCIIQYVLIPSLSGRVCFRFLCFHSDIYFPLTYSHLMQWCFALVSLSFLEIAKYFFSSVATSKVICGLYGRTWFRFVCSRSGLTGSQWILSYSRFSLVFFPSDGIFPSLLVTAFHSNYIFLPLTLVYNPFHGRYLSYNSITSIPSGAFTGLTALNTLWGRGGCFTFVWIDCVLLYFGIPSLF